MTNALLPLRSWDFQISWHAAERQARIDLLEGEEILLHIKALAERRLIAVNSRKDGQWEKEMRLSIPEEMVGQSLQIRLARQDDHLSIQLVGVAGVEYTRYLDRLFDARLQLSPGVTPLPRDGGLHPDSVVARIDRADVMHVAGYLRFTDIGWTDAERLRDAWLLLRIDGRISGSVKLEPAPLESLDPGANFLIEVDSGSFVGDGMVAEIILALGEARMPLVARRISSHFAGGVEFCDDVSVKGFVYNPDLPQRPVLVDVFVNNAFQATVPAQLDRADLAEVTERAAQSGFCLRFPNPIHLPVSMDVSVSVRIHNTAIELANSPWWVCRAVRLDEEACLTEADVAG